MRKKIKQNNSKLVRQKTVQYLNATLLQKGLLSFQIIFDNTSRHFDVKEKAMLID